MDWLPVIIAIVAATGLILLWRAIARTVNRGHQRLEADERERQQTEALAQQARMQPPPDVLNGWTILNDRDELPHRPVLLFERDIGCVVGTAGAYSIAVAGKQLNADAFTHWRELPKLPQVTPRPDPCPFCGGKARFNPGPYWSVECTKCRAAVREFDSPAKAVDAWNHRPPSAE